MKARVFIILTIIFLALGAAGCAAEPAREAPEENATSESPVCGGPTGEGQGPGAAENAGESNAPDFILESLDGRSMALSDFAGQIVVLNFWASWCPPCRAEMPDLNELDIELNESGAAVLITVNLTDGQRETRDTASRYIEENGFGFIVLFDDQMLLAREYTVSAIPQTFVLDRSGNVSGTIIGSTTRAAILDLIDAVK